MFVLNKVMPGVHHMLLNVFEPMEQFFLEDVFFDVLEPRHY